MNRRALVLPVAFFGALLGACQDRGQKDGPSDAAAVSDALGAIADRQRLLTDFAYSGIVENLDDGTRHRFAYALMQPSMLFAALHDEGMSFVYDGTYLVVRDEKKKRVVRQDLSKLDEASLVGTLHQIFGNLACEGWRPPLLRTQKDVLSGGVKTAKDGRPIWVLRSRIDDTEVAEVRYTLRPPKADFLAKEFLDKGGKVMASTRVLKEHLDEKTRLAFPSAWEQKDARGRFRVTLEKIEVNPGFLRDRFSTEVPEGYELVDALGQPG